MASKVLVGIDGSEQSMDALEYALELFPEASVTAIAVIDPVDVAAAGEYPTDSLFEVRREYAENALERATRMAAEMYRKIDTEIRIGPPSRIIVAFAADSSFDHVFVGSRGRTGLSRILLGSVAERVVRRSPVPVTVVR